MGVKPDPGTAQNHSYNPLFGKGAPRSPIAATVMHQPLHPPLWPVVEIADATRASPRRQAGGIVAATRSPVSAVTKTKPHSRSASPLVSESLWGTAPTALDPSCGDDETETSSNALLSTATSNANEKSFASRPPSAAGTTTASDHSSSPALGDATEALSTPRTSGIGELHPDTCGGGSEVRTESRIRQDRFFLTR